MTEIYTTRRTACGEEYAYAREGDTLSDSENVRVDYLLSSHRGHYFSEGALRFFGARNFDTVAPGVSVELQANAPGDRYKVTTWKTSDEGVQPWFGCWHATRREAIKCAKDTAELLKA